MVRDPVASEVLLGSCMIVIVSNDIVFEPLIVSQKTNVSKIYSSIALEKLTAT